MLKKRLIFTLYYDAGYFHLSRNFKLQRVGDTRWLLDKFKFKNIGKYIDEIVILNVGRNMNEGEGRYCGLRESVSELMSQTFVPLTIGGGIRSVGDVEFFLNIGADKVLFNTAALVNPTLVEECVERFGAQAVVGSIDVTTKGSDHCSMTSNGQNIGLPLQDHIEILIRLGVGEIMLNSIRKDGTGMGFDIDLLSQLPDLMVPLIVAGGAGKPEHFHEALSLPNVDAASTGDLFNFVGGGFERVRRHLSGTGLLVRKI